MTSNARELAQIPSTPSGRRNLIINGAKQIFQRSSSATGVTNDEYAAPDRWKTRVFSTAEFTISQSTDVPSGQGFGSSCKWDCTTANASPSSTTFLIYEQRIEGQDLQRLAYGTSSAKSLTASFWVKSNKTGAYTVGLYSPDGSRHIESSYTISSANTWEKKTITFAGDTGGTINDDNGEGMRIWFHLGAGSNWSSGTHATTWSAYSQGDVLVDNQVNLSDSTSNEWYITGVQLEVGSVATEFEHRSFGEELQLCKRYFRNDMDGRNGACSNATTRAVWHIHLDPEMRARPTASLTTGTTFPVDATFTGDRTFTVTAFDYPAGGDANFHQFRIYGNLNSALTVGQAIMIDDNHNIEVDAEL